jgi:flagellar motility protein MotE (MotC chaperone)
MMFLLRLRPLPVVIVLVVLFLGLRVGDLWLHTGTAQAQRLVPQQEGPPPVSPTATPAPAAAPAAPAPESGSGSEAPASSDDVTSLTGPEIQVLQQLVARRSEIEKRAADLDRREATLKAAEERIDAKIQEIKKLQGGVEQAIRRYDEQEEQRRMNLVRIYETMKPGEAAKIFEQLELQNLVELVERMSTRKVAPVLAAMNPVRAKQVTSELEKRRKPGDPVTPTPVAANTPAGG